jgi:hypothetical protein
MKNKKSVKFFGLGFYVLIDFSLSKVGEFQSDNFDYHPLSCSGGEEAVIVYCSGITAKP